ncbi:uncharacterized protein LOC18422547 [Amborella trichopoda]|uniref:Uncharacterized protein n=1 Tax=Amborella trichopoda TaxID=13333 RepID=W1NG01_AMBTC|nr:uncharacterized protein LOC18422547 [Amborella trichopoda]ERM94697.1 hypothetical protein AMTR_s00011p00234270 [Amborella trichopoda]|eukprot:XP_006878552.1 uncharacterized protein LOC18422547 [Amborella trichopoda]
MGSLMAGWGSPTKDPKHAIYQRNKSFTKEEIESFWKSKKRIEEEHLRSISSLSPNSEKDESKSERQVLERSKSFPVTSSSSDLEKLRLASDWWTRSNWAFLNEPPVTAMEGPSYKYAAQYHLTELGSHGANTNSMFDTSKPDLQPGIST